MSTVLTLSIVSLTSLCFLSGFSVRVCVRWPDYGIRIQNYCSVDMRRGQNSQLLVYEEAVSRCRLAGGFVNSSALGGSDFAALKIEVNYSDGSQRTQVSGGRLRVPSLNCSKSVTTRPGCNVICAFKTCPVGSFGLPECQIPCRCEDPDRCDIATGLCIDTNCSRGFFGPPVCRKCNCHQDALCNKVTGECPFGCKKGWSGKSCYQRICRGGKCPRASSVGDDNCKTGDNCPKRVCPQGFFNPPACNMTCYCLYEQLCDGNNGDCGGTPCVGRRTGRNCQDQECSLMHYGMPDCTSLCFCDGRQPCDTKTGKCPIGCSQGWSGNTCNQRHCPEGLFSYPACNLFCNCKNQDACNSLSGVCEVDGCADGHNVRGGNCTKEIPLTPEGVHSSTYSTFSAFALVFGTVIVILAVCVQSMTHRQDPQSSGPSTLASGAASSGSSSSITTHRKSRMSYLQMDNRYLSIASREPAFALTSFSEPVSTANTSLTPKNSTCV